MRKGRRARIIGDADLRRGRCLEIGPLANPVVGSDVADVRYVDIVDRAGLISHYNGNPAVDPEAIPEQHFWLTREDGSISTLAEAVASDAPYEHVVASHVIEHVPDMIAWLRDVAEVLTEGGALVLAIPDRRFCFDARRAPASAGQVVQAHLDQDRMPSARAVLDHFLRAVDFDAERAWAGEPVPLRGSHSLEEVRGLYARQRLGEYVDCHVWPLTPQGFAELVDDLLALDFLDFTVERITATRAGDQEFYATLRRLPRQGDRHDHVETARARLSDLQADLPPEVGPDSSASDDEVKKKRLIHLEQQLAEAHEKLARARAARDRLRLQRDSARARIEELGVPLARKQNRVLPRLGRRPDQQG